MKKATSIEEYLADLPAKQRAALETLRKVIKTAAPQATESISWGMPTFKDTRPLVAYAAFKEHLSFFVMSTAVMDDYKDELAAFDSSKGTIRFQPEKPLPVALVKKLVKARIEENAKRGIKTGRKPATRRARYPMPDYIEQELEGRGLMDAYRARPPYQRNDYVGWITSAKQAATRQKRLDQMLEELEQGDLYMKMAYSPRKKPGK